VGLFKKKPKSQPKMKTLKVDLGVEPKASKKKSKTAAAKPMDFEAWVDDYVQKSKGNPV
jgi:hypothetical protein